VLWDDPQLIRVLNASIHLAQEQVDAACACVGVGEREGEKGGVARSEGARELVVYVQGMNAIAGVLLLECNEVDAVSLVLALRLRHCPLYFRSTLDGVHTV
jgi:hypothetical protein